MVCLISVAEISFYNRVSAISQAQCIDTVKTMDTVVTFQYLADVLVPNHRGLKDEEAKVVNNCLHSVDGYGDLKAFKSVVELASTSSVCQPEFADQLLAVDKQLKANVSRGKLLGRKQKHRLSRFFRLFAGQVVLTCKKSLVRKLESVENDEELVASLNRITEVSSLKNKPLDKSETKKLNGPMRKVMNLAMKYTPTVFNKAENIILVESLKPTQDSALSIKMTFNTQQALEEFMSTKKACKKIEEYAQSSIYTIPRLAFRGYLARDDRNNLDVSLTENKIVLKWIKAVQYCQGILLVQANLDLENDVIEKLDKEILEDEQIFTVDMAKDSKSSGAIAKTQAHKFEEPDTFDSFDANLKCFTHSKGLAGWLLKRSGGERLLAKYIKLSVLDESIKQSLLASQEDPEQEVQFATAVMHNGGTAAGGHAVTHLPWETHASHMPVSHEIAVAVAVVVGCILAIWFFIFMVKRTHNIEPSVAKEPAADP